MVSFESDYINGAHEKVLEALIKSNDDVLTGYGKDKYCESASKKIKEACGCEDADVYFISGGTQTNAVVISSVLLGHESVIAAETGHINYHEAGAIEYTGHKVIALKGEKGKLSADVLNNYLADFNADANRDHMAQPAMVYISFPTEYGTIYGKDELAKLYEVCRRYGLSLFVDGARLGYGLMSRKCDFTLKELAKLCDVFYIGGTKVGALCGEAVVFTHGNAPKGFFTSVKQHGALLAKGRLMGVQFDALFTDGLYFEIGRHAIDAAERLKEIFRKKNYKFFMETDTNQQFIVLENEKMRSLKEKVAFGFWEKFDDTHTVVRFATSWSTKKEDLDELEEAL